MVTHLLLTALILGEVALLLDLGSRLFGTYARTLFGAMLRIAIVVAACCALATPAILSLAFEESESPRGLWFSAGLAVVVMIHFLFPLRFGIRRTTGGRPPDVTQLLPGIRLRTETFASSLVPESADGFECLVLSDLHCNSVRRVSQLREAVAALKDSNSDCVFLLGDLGESSSLLPDLIEAVAALPEKQGKFFVRSNHDFEGGREEIVGRHARDHSIRVLANESVLLPDSGISLLGLEYPWNTQGNSTVAGDTFAIGLTHTPDNLTHFARLGVPLSVAGHTHGGKLKLPLIGPLLVPSKFGRFFDHGWFFLGQSHIFVTKGVGYFPGVFGSQGEIVKLRLVRSRQ